MNTNLHALLSGRFAEAIEQVAGEPRDPIIKPSGDPTFGDYQCNAAMGLAKRLKQKPRDVAQSIVEAVQLDDLAEPLEIAGPGFINIRLKPECLTSILANAAQDRQAAPESPPVRPSAYPSLASITADRLGIAESDAPQTIVIDYSSPNIAKQMHVGHLRTTIIGDVFARVLGFFGHNVIRQNHVGDWGTQFGMLITWYGEHEIPSPETTPDVLAKLEEDYRAAAARFKEDTAFAEASRAAVTRLQGGDAGARAIWEQLCQLSREAFLRVYHRLGVLLTDNDVRGESFYNSLLAETVALLKQRLEAGDVPDAKMKPDQGAECIYLYNDKGEPAYKNPDGDPLPMIVQKSDGAYLYATTDLAALRYRCSELGANRIIYVTDARQKMHFQMLFQASRAAGFAPAETRLDHVTFGSVLGEDRKPLKTRSGSNVKLEALLDEAQRRALQLLEQRNSEQPDDVPTPVIDDHSETARVLGIGAVKYADLRNDRNTDYVFDWDKLISFQGNTAPYMLYAYARVRSIYRKAAEKSGATAADHVRQAQVILEAPEEHALALRLARFRETLDSLAEDLLPHTLCSYLFELAGDFMRFYEHCPVLAAEKEELRHSRMALCDLTARTLRLGLGLLGIETVERM
jgi:arginyl-tRNA synthetase